MDDEVLSPGIELLESMRSVGYSFEDAIADLMDNSITANATHIDLTGDPHNGQYVAVIDDGDGMSPTEARRALRLAGTGSELRKDSDLGRFGLGLKTASLSQGRQLTLATKQNDQLTIIQWDLDYVRAVGDWRIRVLDRGDIDHIPESKLLDGRASGTMVLWEALDHLIGSSANPAKVMSNLLAELRDHLGLVFHQFLDKRHIGGLSITVNTTSVKPIDPFLSTNPKTQRTPVERFTIQGSEVEMQSFVLPHSSALSEKELRRHDLSYAMQAQQGFYVYRAHRLIDWGKWYGITRQSQLKKQTRVKVDFPNTLDHLWQLDIRKSKVRPPREFLDYYRDAILNETKKSERIHTFRGRRQPRGLDVTPLWNLIEDRNEVRYEVNPENPLVQGVLEDLEPPQRNRVRELLQDIASHMPVQSAYVELAENKTVTTVKHDSSDVKSRIMALHSAGFLPKTSTQIVGFLSGIEPFASYPDLKGIVDEMIGDLDG